MTSKKGPKKSAYAKAIDDARRIELNPDYGPLTDTDKLVLQQILRSPGITNAEISRAFLNLSTTKVGTIRRKPAFQAALADMTQTTDELLKEAAARGARRLRKLVDSPDDKIALDAIKVALGPNLKGPQEPGLKRKILFRTTVSPDGSLLQEVMDEESLVDAALGGEN